jgi:hypothetical protein
MIEDDVMTNFEVIFGYEQMLKDIDLKKKCYVNWKVCYRKFSLPI